MSGGSPSTWPVTPKACPCGTARGPSKSPHRCLTRWESSRGPLWGPSSSRCLRMTSRCSRLKHVVVQYADDTQVIVSGKKNELPSLIAKMETSLASLDIWFRSNSLKVNASKTQLIVLGNRQNLRTVPNFEVAFRGTSLVPCSEVKNLGVIFDRHLSWGQSRGCRQPALQWYADRTVACAPIAASRHRLNARVSSGALADPILSARLW